MAAKTKRQHVLIFAISRQKMALAAILSLENNGPFLKVVADLWILLILWTNETIRNRLMLCKCLLASCFVAYRRFVIYFNKCKNLTV